jgi:hypothetical protein
MRKKQKTHAPPLKMADQCCGGSVSIGTLVGMGQPYQNPLPTLTVVDEASNDRGDKVSASKEESIIAHIGASFVHEPLHSVSCFLAFEAMRLYSIGRTTSATETPHKDSIGAPKKPCSTLFAVHWEVVVA